MNRNNMLLRGCMLRNTEAVIGIVAYAGVCVLVRVSVSVCLYVCMWVWVWVGGWVSECVSN